MTASRTPGTAMTETGVADRVVHLSTGPVFYRDSGGEGVPVVFLHAASGNSLLWTHQIPAFLQAGYRFVAIDYRGVGGKAGAYDWSDQIDALLSTLGIERFHLLGTAAGGGTAFQYALAYEKKLRSLVIANSHGNVSDPEYVAMGKRIRPSPQFDALPLDFRELGPSYRAAEPEGVARWLALSAAQPGAATLHEPMESKRDAQPLRSDRFALIEARTVTWAKLEALRVPTLFVTGDADLYTPPSVLRMFVSHVPHAEGVVIPETGHSSYWEQPAAFNTAVLAFLASH